MKVCIYCKQSENNTTFSSKEGEHIIPQFLGRFNLYFGDNVVCQNCNNKLSKIETNFKEDSLEGIYSAIWGIREANSIRIKKNNLNWTISSQDGDLGIFEEVFPFINPAEQNIYPKPIIIIKPKDRKNNIIDVLFVEKYADLAKKKNRDFRKKKNWIKKLQQNGKLDISIFGNQNWTIEKIKDMLNEYGIVYNENSREFFDNKNRGKIWEIEFNITIDRQILKVPAKTAFNYFAYCARQSGMLNILMDHGFDKIRNFIKDEYNKDEKPPVDVLNKSILYDEKNSEKRRIVHIVTFRKENDLIISEITLFGFFNYKVTLGKYPLSIKTNNFGCATVFDPFSKSIINSIYATAQPIIGKIDYGLFNR